MDTISPHLEGLPDTVRTKYQLFQKQEETIRRLEAELENLRVEHSQLEEELAPYQSSIRRNAQLSRSKHWKITYPRNRGPIHACPEEVLYEIFQYYLASHHYRIRDLLLVCKTWYDIIMGNPRFWARIQTPAVNEYEACSSVFDDITIPYITACLERSRNLPLDIELSLGWMPSFHDYISHHAYTALEDIVDPTTFRNGFSTIQWPDTYFDTYTYFNYKHRFLDLLQNDVERWRCLSITFPDGDAGAEAILKSLPLNRVDPQSLELFNIGSERFNYWDEDTNLLPDLSGIKYLNSSRISLSQFTGSPSSLVELEIIATQLSDIQSIIGCTMLQSLTLDMRDGIHKPTPPGLKYRELLRLFGRPTNSSESTIGPDESPPPLPPLHLSSLRKFSMVGYIEPLSWFNFDTPVLDSLEIYPRAQNYPWSMKYKTLRMPELPKVSARRIHWRMHSWEENEFIHGLGQVLLQFRDADIMKITIPVGYSSRLTTLLKLYSTNRSMIIKSRSEIERWYQKEVDSILVSLQGWAKDNGYSVTLQPDLDIDREFLEE